MPDEIVQAVVPVVVSRNGITHWRRARPPPLIAVGFDHHFLPTKVPFRVSGYQGIRVSGLGYIFLGRGHRILERPKEP